MKSLITLAWKFDEFLAKTFATRPRILGWIYAFIASIFSFMNPLVIQFSGEKNTVRVMVSRFIFMVFLSIAVIKSKENPRTWVHKSVIYKLVFRGFLAVTLFFFFYWGLNYLNLQIVLSLFQTSIGITFFLGLLVGQEKFSKLRCYSILGVFVGVCLIISPGLLFFSFSWKKEGDESNLHILAIFSIFLSAFLKALITILLKSLKENDPMINNIYTGVTNIVLCGMIFIFTSTNFAGTTLFALGCFFLNGFTAFFTVTFTFKALKLEDGSIVTVINSLGILYGFLFNVFVSGDIPEVGAVVGSFLVLIFMSLLTLGELIAPTKSKPSEEAPKDTQKA